MSFKKSSQDEKGTHLDMFLDGDGEEQLVANEIGNHRRYHQHEYLEKEYQYKEESPGETKMFVQRQRG